VTNDYFQTIILPSYSHAIQWMLSLCLLFRNWLNWSVFCLVLSLMVYEEHALPVMLP